MNELLSKLKGKLIVSCQALEDEPLNGAQHMRQMAVAAVQGGAAGIRANGPDDIRAIKSAVNVPVIGIYKRVYPDTEVYLTVTIEDVAEIVQSGADIIAMDATSRLRPGNQTSTDFLQQVKARFPDKLFMADVSTVREGIEAAIGGADMISTTFAGYTPYTSDIQAFDFDLLDGLLREVSVPVIAEGRIHTPELAAECVTRGAFAVVVGSAITRPQFITHTFANKIREVRSVL